MDAVEFVKEFGFEVVKNICDKYFSYTHVTDDARMLIDEIEYKKYAPHFADDLNNSVKIEDLKRLVESHELVKKRGGLRLAVVFRWSEKFKSLSREHQDKFDKAIADVESCK